MFNQRTSLRAATLFAALSLVACSGEDSNPTGSPGVVVSLEVTPSTGSIRTAGATLQLSAVARDARGREIPGMAVTWSSSDPTRARVDDAGMVTALSGGTVTIAARAGGVSGEAVLDIQLPPVQLTREERFAIAALLADASVEGLDFGFGQMFSRASSQLENRADEISISFRIVRDCPLGGNILTEGTFNARFDRETRSGEFELNADKTITDCEFMKRDAIVRLRTDQTEGGLGPIVIHAHGSHGHGDAHDRPHAEAVLTIDGTLFIKRGEEEEFECLIDLEVTWSTESGTTVSGSICGHDVSDHDRRDDDGEGHGDGNDDSGGG